MTNPIKLIFAVAAAIILSTAHDTASNGIPTSWALQYGLNPFDPNLASEDPDGDGQNNWTEFITGFDPTNASSLWIIQASPTNGLAPVTVNFSDNITIPTVTNRLWDFGDGGMSTGAAPAHTYSSTGVFTVSETAFGVNGTAILTESEMITLIPEPSTLLLTITGLLGLMFAGRNRS